MFQKSFQGRCRRFGGKKKSPFSFLRVHRVKATASSFPVPVRIYLWNNRITLLPFRVTLFCHGSFVDSSHSDSVQPRRWILPWSDGSGRCLAGRRRVVRLHGCVWTSHLQHRGLLWGAVALFTLSSPPLRNSGACGTGKFSDSRHGQEAPVEDRDGDVEEMLSGVTAVVSLGHFNLILFYFILFWPTQN